MLYYICIACMYSRTSELRTPQLRTVQLNEEAGYKSAIAGSNFRDFAWHLKWSREEKKLLSLNLCPFTFLLA